MMNYYAACFALLASGVGCAFLVLIYQINVDITLGEERETHDAGEAIMARLVQVCYLAVAGLCFLGTASSVSYIMS